MSTNSDSSENEIIPSKDNNKPFVSTIIRRPQPTNNMKWAT